MRNFLLRLVMAMLVAITLQPWALRPTSPAHAEESDPREFDRRVQVIVKSITIHDDHDWGVGDFSVDMIFYRVGAMCPVEHPGTCSYPMVSSKHIYFPANDGQTFVMDRALPDARLNFTVTEESIDPTIGIPLQNDRAYFLDVLVEEKDTFVDDYLGYVRLVLKAEDGWQIGTHQIRAKSPYHAGAGDFTATIEIREAPLPDLRPTDLRVTDLPGTSKSRVCVPVQNAGVKSASAFEVAVRVDGLPHPDGRFVSDELASGDAVELCKEMALPSPGQHHLSAVVNPERAIEEVSRTNNRVEGSYIASRVGESQSPQAKPPVGNVDGGQGVAGAPTDPAVPTGPAAQPSPGAANADLIVTAIRVRGQVPDGKDDCKDGKNTVTVVVKNVGAASAGAFVVGFAVNGGDALEASATGLESGKEREIKFGDVKLKKGEQALTATVDAKGAVAESNEGNNELKISASCKDDN